DRVVVRVVAVAPATVEDHERRALASVPVVQRDRSRARQERGLGDRLHAGDELRHFPLYVGLRFSRKAVTPSFASSLLNTRKSASRSTFSPSANGRAMPCTTASLICPIAKLAPVAYARTRSSARSRRAACGTTSSTMPAASASCGEIA